MSPVARNRLASAESRVNVRERVLRVAGERGMIPLHLALRALGPADHQHREHAEHQHQHDQRQSQLPVQDDGQRQQHDGGQQRRQMLAEERQPHPEQAVGAGEHHLHHLA
jgi:hypothetical protein